MPEKLYEVLGVDEDASRSEVREAYRRAVKESHPDLSDDPGADERFQLVMRAKDVLTDPDERELYDDLGHATYMDMFGDDDGTAASSSGGRSETDGAASAGSPSGAKGAPGGASDSDPPDSAASTSRSATEGGSSTSSAASASSAGGPTGDRASTSPESDAASGSGTDASTGSGTDASTASGTGAATDSGGSEDGPTRGGGGAVSGATVAGEAERSRKEWQAAARRGETDETSPWSTGSAQGDHLEAERVEPGIATKVRSQDAAVTALVMLVVYPVFLFATIWPTFPTEVNAFIGVVTLGVVMYTMTEPAVSLVVFGTWSVLTPLLLAFIGIDLVSVPGLLALTASWVPFVLSVLLTLAMPD